jgi:hypothetical protein
VLGKVRPDNFTTGRAYNPTSRSTISARFYSAAALAPGLHSFTALRYTFGMQRRAREFAETLPLELMAHSSFDVPSCFSKPSVCVPP